MKVSRFVVVMLVGYVAGCMNINQMLSKTVEKRLKKENQDAGGAVCTDARIDTPQSRGIGIPVDRLEPNPQVPWERIAKNQPPTKVAQNSVKIQISRVSKIALDGAQIPPTNNRPRVDTDSYAPQRTVSRNNLRAQPQAQIDSLGNISKGRRNIIVGADNYVLGERNIILGSQNILDSETEQCEENLH